jgi:hypothetical protein
VEGAMITVHTAVAPPHPVVHEHHFCRHSARSPPQALQLAQEWRWSWGITPLTCQTTSLWVKP